MTSNLTRVLPYAGALPFMAGALLLLFNSETLPLIGDAQHAVLSYGLVILSFMAGVHWGQFLSGARGAFNLLLTSNAIALAGWFGFLLLPPLWFCLLLVLLFALVYVIDRPIHSGTDYLTMRRNVTGIVCVSLLLTAYSLASG
jgi:hypothetical protein